MKISSINSWTKVAIFMFFIGLSILIISIVIFVVQYFSLGSIFDSKVASELGGYISGFVGVFWTGAGAILVYATFQEQKKLLVKQQFESSFFKLLDTYNVLIASISLNSTNNVSGKATFTNLLKEIKKSNWDKDMWENWLDSDMCNIPEIIKIKSEYDSRDPGTKALEDLKTFTFSNGKHLQPGDRSDEFYFGQFDYFFNKYKSTMESFCRFISNILKYVEVENRDEKIAEKYLKILWSQMTEEELVILFYYAKNKELKGDPKFLTRLKKYNFLGDLSQGAFLRSDHKKRFC
jgi:hypothetical protein